MFLPVVAAISAALFAAQPASATYPGKNGRIALLMDRGSGQQIYTIRPNGSGLTRVTDVDGVAEDPDWSPDGTKIVFDVRSPDGGQCEIDLINADGTGLVVLTGPRFSRPDSCQYAASFTPDGRRIVYAAQRCGRCTLAIWSMNLQGHDRRRIFRPDGFAFQPEVSPDGTTLLYGEERNAHIHGVKVFAKGLFTVRMNGTHPVQVLPFKLDAGIGEWAPNGKRIDGASHVDRDSFTESSNLFSVRPDGTGLRYLTQYRSTSPDVFVGSGTYSPNGRWIDFKRADSNKGKYVLWKIHPDGTGQTRIRDFKVTFSGRDWGPTGKLAA